MTDHDGHIHCRITIAGTVSDRFARGCRCEVSARTGDGTTILGCDIPTAADAGRVLAALGNLGVDVLAVDMDDRRDGDVPHGGGDSR